VLDYERKLLWRRENTSQGGEEEFFWNVQGEHTRLAAIASEIKP
jgi:hypothetical protein